MLKFLHVHWAYGISDETLILWGMGPLNHNPEGPCLALLGSISSLLSPSMHLLPEGRPAIKVEGGRLRAPKVEAPLRDFCTGAEGKVT